MAFNLSTNLVPQLAEDTTQTGPSPSITLSDNTASAKDLLIIADGDKAELREAAGAANSLVTLDLTNNRVGVGVASPGYAVDVLGTVRTSSEFIGPDLSSGSTTGAAKLLGGGANQADIAAYGSSHATLASTAIIKTMALERMRIDAAGNVGIGTLANASQLLHVKSAATSSAYFLLEQPSVTLGKAAGVQFKNDSKHFFLGLDYSGTTHTDFELYDISASAKRLVVNTAGAVAIPGVLNLGVATNATGDLYLGKENTNLSIYGEASGSYGVAVSGLTARGTLAARTASGVGDVGLYVQGKCWDGSAARTMAAIQIEVDGTVGASDVPGNIRFLTVPDGSVTLAERLRISSEGLVSVGGTASGVSKLEVINDVSALDTPCSFKAYGASANTNQIQFRKTRNAAPGSHTVVVNNDILGELSFRGSDSANYQPAARIAAEVDGTPGAGDMPGRLVFSTTVDGTAAVAERMRISANGTVAFSHLAASGATGGAVTISHNISGSWALDVNANNYGIISRAGYNNFVGSTRIGDANTPTSGLDIAVNPKFSGTNSTGAGTASLSTNCPAVDATAPYTWITVVSSDGSTCFIPLWK